MQTSGSQVDEQYYKNISFILPYVIMTSFLVKVPEYYKKLQQKGKKPLLRCKFCDKELQGTTRFITHLAGCKGKAGAEATACPKVPDEVRAAALQHVRGTPISQEEEDIIEVEEPQSSKQPRRESSSSKSSSQTQPMQAHITSYTQPLKHGEANEAISSWLYECGIPFNTTRHPAWREMWDKVRNAGPGFRPLSYNTLRTTELSRVRKLLQVADQCKKEVLASKYGSLAFVNKYGIASRMFASASTLLC
jgi:hypothetical protein